MTHEPSHMAKSQVDLVGSTTLRDFGRSLRFVPSRSGISNMSNRHDTRARSRLGSIDVYVSGSVYRLRTWARHIMSTRSRRPCLCVWGVIRWGGSIRMRTSLLDVNAYPCRLSRITYHHACRYSKIHHIWYRSILLRMIHHSRRRSQWWWTISDRSRSVRQSIRWPRCVRPRP
jgi:hypothetical protein